MSSQIPTIAVLGAGSLGGAILEGLIARAGGIEAARDRLRVTTRSATSAEALAARTGLTVVATETAPEANLDAVRGAEVVLLAVKPAMIAALAEEIAPALAEQATEARPLVVSVAAGVTTASIEQRLPEGTAVLRGMPNTPALVRQGVTGLAAGSAVSAEQLGAATAIFEAVGTVVVVPEEQIDALTGISGSGPAYLFLLVEHWIAAARARGFDEEQARALVLGTVTGSAALLEATGEDPAELRRKVTSPNGTTQRALEVFATGELAELFDRATAAATARAAELAAANA